MALRYYLKQNGLATTATGGGDVLVKPTTPNSDAVLEFQSGQIAGASEPAPYDVEMVQDGGKVLLNEPGSTTLLMVTQSFLTAHPSIVADLLKANLQALDLIKSNPAKAEADADAEYASYTGKSIKPALVAASFKQIDFTDDPDEASIATAASEAVSLGLLKEPVSLGGMYDLTELNTLLGRPASGPWAPDPETEMSATEMTTKTVTEASAVSLAGVSKVYGARLRRRPGSGPGVPLGCAGRVRLPDRRVRLRQVDAALAGGRAGQADGGQHRTLRPGGDDVPGAGAVSVAHAPAATSSWRCAPAASAAPSAASGPRELLDIVRLGGSAASARTSCPAACGSGSRWPGPSPRTRTCC